MTSNVVSTYLGSVNYTGTTGSWPIRNAHGDVLGTTDTNATFVANAPTDEYGKGMAPADRLLRGKLNVVLAIVGIIVVIVVALDVGGASVSIRPFPALAALLGLGAYRLVLAWAGRDDQE